MCSINETESERHRENEIKIERWLNGWMEGRTKEKQISLNPHRNE